jgi:hypothetical protein
VLIAQCASWNLVARNEKQARVTWFNCDKAKIVILIGSANLLPTPHIADGIASSTKLDFNSAAGRKSNVISSATTNDFAAQYSPKKVFT